MLDGYCKFEGKLTKKGRSGVPSGDSQVGENYRMSIP